MCRRLAWSPCAIEDDFEVVEVVNDARRWIHVEVNLERPGGAVKGRRAVLAQSAMLDPSAVRALMSWPLLRSVPGMISLEASITDCCKPPELVKIDDASSPASCLASAGAASVALFRVRKVVDVPRGSTGVVADHSRGSPSGAILASADSDSGLSTRALGSASYAKVAAPAAVVPGMPRASTTNNAHRADTRRSAMNAIERPAFTVDLPGGD